MFVAIGGLIVLALTTALVAPYFIDWTSYRADFEREASRILGRAVKVEGTASARLLPFPSVTFTDVIVAGRDSEEPAMTIETFSMDAELAPAMRGDFHIFDMRLVRPVATVEIAVDGTLDWAVRPSVPLDASHISLEKLTITEGQVALRHDASGRTHRLTEINADLSARALTGPWRMDGTLRFDGLRSTVSASTGAVDDTGAMRLRLRVQPDLYPLVVETDGATRVEAGVPHYSGQFRLNASTTEDRLRTGDGGTISLKEDSGQPARDAPPPAYRISGAFDFGHAALGVEQFRFETGLPEDPYTAEGSARFDLGTQPRFEIRADGAQFRFDNGDGGAEGGGASFADRMSAIREALFDLPRPTIPGSIEVALPAIVAGDTTVRDVRLSAHPSKEGWSIASLKATLPGRTTLEAQGELLLAESIGFAGDLLLAIGQPSGFAAWLSRDVDEAIRRLPAAGFSANVDLQEERQQFRDLELILGTARFRGEIDSRTPAVAKPSMTLRLDGDSLDMEGMSAFASLFLGEGGQTRLAERDLEFQIKAGPVSAGGLSAETLDTALRLRDGQLDVDRLSIGGLAGANISATGIVSDLAGLPVGTLDASVIASDLAPLVDELAARFPDSVIATGLANRASFYPGLLEDANLQFVATAQRGDERTQDAALDVSGTVGGTTLDFSAKASALTEALDKTPISARFSAHNDEAAALYAMLGVPGLPFGLVGPAQTQISFEGVLADGGQTRFAFSGDGLTLDYEGEVARADAGLSGSGSASLRADDIEPWLAVAGLSLPGFGLGLPVALDSQLDLDDGLLLISGLKGNIGGSAVGGDINAKMRDGRPHLTGSLSVASFDLALLADLIVGEQATVSGGETWPTVPFAGSVDTPVTTDLDIAAERLQLGGFGTGERGQMTLRIAQESVTLADATLQAFGGTVSGLVDVRNDRGTGILSSQFRLDGGRVQDLLGDVGVKAEVDVTGTVSGSGKTVEGLMASLAGSGTVAARDLSISGINPDAFPALLVAADRFGPDIDANSTDSFAGGLVRQGAFSTDALDFAFTIANGTARVPPIRIASEAAVLAGELRADLGAATVGANMVLTYAAGPEALVGSEPSVRITAAGPLDAPAIEVDTEMLTQFLTQRALELEQQRVEAMQAALLERQRHRREVRYYTGLAEQREKAAEDARRAVEQAERLRRELQAEQEEAARKQAAQEAERLRREREENQRRQEQEERTRLDAVPPAGAVTDGAEPRDRFFDSIEELLEAPTPTPDTLDAVPTPRPAPRAAQSIGSETSAPAAQTPVPSPSSDGFFRMIFGD